MPLKELFYSWVSKMIPGPSPELIAGQLRRPSGKWARRVGKKMNQSNEYLYGQLIKFMNLKEGDSVLEIGFGNGMFFEKLFSTTENLHVSGIDYSEDMVKQALDFNRKRIELGKLNIQKGNSDQLPFPGNRFDKVFCVNVVYFWENPDNHLREILRVLKPGGFFFTGIRTKESLKQIPFTKHGFRLYEEEEWKFMLRVNGFAGIKAEQVKEPATEFKGKPIVLESLCISAAKEK